MTLKVRHVEEYDAYELVENIEGVPIVFSRLDGPAVRSQIENAKAAEGQDSSSASGSKS